MVEFPKAAPATVFFPLGSIGIIHPRSEFKALNAQFEKGNSMISVHLTEDLEFFIRDAVLTGRYANEDDVISDALVRLRNTINRVLIYLIRAPSPPDRGRNSPSRNSSDTWWKSACWTALPRPDRKLTILTN